VAANKNPTAAKNIIAFGIAPFLIKVAPAVYMHLHVWWF
jgi:hypothetical protein